MLGVTGDTQSFRRRSRRNPAAAADAANPRRPSGGRGLSPVAGLPAVVPAVWVVVSAGAVVAVVESVVSVAAVSTNIVKLLTARFPAPSAAA